MDLKILIKNTEARFIFYKNQLKMISKEKISYPIDNEFIIWYKTFLREQKNAEEKRLKELIKEKRFENEGLNSPFYYKF